MVNDSFGVRMIYPTKSGGDEWMLNSAGSNLRGESTSKGSDSAGDYYTISSTQVRGSAITKHGYSQGDINMDSSDIDLNVGGTGHMMKAGGFRDVEMTGYYYITSSSDDDYVHYCRGGTHTDGRECEGQAYKAAVNYQNGEVRVRKEQWHPSGYVSADWRAGFGRTVRNRWGGFKAVFVNRGAAPNISVYIECWVDKNADNNWERVYTFTDSGQSAFGGDGKRCGGKSNQVLTWSGPFATFRWDTSGVRFKKLSVREIKEDGNFTEPPPPGGGTPPPGQPPPGEDPFMRLVYPSTGVTASGDNGNVAANVNDQNINTVWTMEGLPAWVKIDMGALKKISSFRIAWTRGNERTVGFNIETSEDNITFTQRLSKSTSGATEDFEDYDVTDVNGRYVKINVLTNSQKNTASIREIEIHGDNTPIGQEPPAGPEPVGPDPAFLYIKRKHTYNVNYTSEDLCGGG
jgi:hypothetical protein